MAEIELTLIVLIVFVKTTARNLFDEVAIVLARWKGIKLVVLGFKREAEVKGAASVLRGT